ncbi:MAG: polyprenyl synthetase family protein [Pseudomonadota bacterium]
MTQQMSGEEMAKAMLARIDAALENCVAKAQKSDVRSSPATISEALHYALFPGGGRVRPRLSLAVSMACGDPFPHVANAAACAIELLHCASLVHDDMPCFDDAPTRRGKPALHIAYGQPIALLAGDALIVMAFEAIARACESQPVLTAPLVRICGEAVSCPSGIIAGQAWESEAAVPLHDYHFAKTAALFVGATMGGAAAAGSDPEPWRGLGEALGSAYQVADDLRDYAGDEAEIGKPVGQDVSNDRPNAVAIHGVEATLELMRSHINAAVDAVPECDGSDLLRGLIHGEAKRLVPKSLAQYAA